MTEKIFDSEILNDALSENLIVVLPNDLRKMSVAVLFNFNPYSIVVEVFPAGVPVDSFDKLGFGVERRKEKDKILYRLKKEGFRFVSMDGRNGFYVK